MSCLNSLLITVATAVLSIMDLSPYAALEAFWSIMSFAQTCYLKDILPGNMVLDPNEGFGHLLQHLSMEQS